MAIFLFTLLTACNEQRETVHVNGVKITLQQTGEPTYCIGKSNRARPSCWSQYDWKIYCEHVQCKRPKNK